MVIVYSARTEYTKYICSLKEEKELPDTFIYKVVPNICNLFFCIPVETLMSFLHSVEGKGVCRFLFSTLT